MMMELVSEKEQRRPHPRRGRRAVGATRVPDQETTIDEDIFTFVLPKFSYSWSGLQGSDFKTSGVGGGKGGVQLSYVYLFFKSPPKV